MEGFRFSEERSYFMEFKLNEEEAYFQIHDFSSTFQPCSSVDDCLQEASFSENHFVAITISDTSILQEEFDALSEIDGDFTSIWPQMEDAYCKSMEGDREKELNLGCDRVEKDTKMQGRRGGGGDKKLLTFEQVSSHFSMPIKQAARELNVGLTVLKKRCRELGIPRWPHRKVKSLQTLINNVQELGKETEQVDGDRTRTVVVMLQQTTKMIEERPAMLLDKNTKVLRQACFKENFKRRRLMRSRPMLKDDCLLMRITERCAAPGWIVL